MDHGDGSLPGDAIVIVQSPTTSTEVDDLGFYVYCEDILNLIISDTVVVLG